MKKIIPIIYLALGIFLIIFPTFQSARTVAVWSDFDAYKFRVLQDKQCAHVLNIGGEDNQESFDDLLEKIWNLHTNLQNIRIVGVLVALLSVIQIISTHSRKTMEKQSGT